MAEHEDSAESNEVNDNSHLAECRLTFKDCKAEVNTVRKAVNPRDVCTKANSKIPSKKKQPTGQLKGYTKLCLCGISLMGVACLAHFLDPIQLAKDIMLNMKDGSYIYRMWKTPPIKLYIKIYMFNITNAVRFMQGKDVRLKVQEIGPYTYSETVINSDIKWNENHTVSYTPERTVKFEPEYSIGDPTKDIITAINIPLLGISSAMHNSSAAINLGLSTLVSYLDSQPLLKLSIHDFLWGYDDPLVQLARNVLPSWIDFNRFGILDRLLDEGHNRVTMIVNKTNDNEPYSIQRFNGSPGLKLWGYDPSKNSSINKCNNIDGAMEGFIFPRDLTPNHTFNVFRRSFCRPLPIIFDKEITTDSGYPAYLYKFPDDILDEKNPDNQCYCNEKESCPTSGLTDLSPCYYNIPVALSLPHFIKGNHSLVQAIDGMVPNETKHSTVFAIQPEVGVPLYVKIRIQTNLLVKKTKFIPRVRRFNNLAIPIFWMEIEFIKLPWNVTILLDLLLIYGPIILTISTALFIILGLALVFAANLRYAWYSGLLDRRKTATIITYKQKQLQQERIVLKHNQYAQLIPPAPYSLLNNIRIR